MRESEPNIVFWGTPGAGADCLQQLLDSGHIVSGVVTQPDRPVGRRQTITAPPVKQIALRREIPVLQPGRLKDPVFIEQIKSWQPDICVIVAYGRIIPRELIAVPRAFLNLHFSLLPRYRGAAPVQWAIMNGDTVTGVTVQHLALELDTGDIIFQQRQPISADDTSETLLKKCVARGAPLLERAVDEVWAGSAPRMPQQAEAASYAPKITKEHGYITWHAPARAICNQVRACTPWPRATTWYNGTSCKIHAARVLSEQAQAQPPGTLLKDRKQVHVVAEPGIVEITALQPCNRARMSAEAFLAGHHHVTHFTSWKGDTSE